MSKDRSALRKGMESIEREAPQGSEIHPVRKLTALSAERGVVHIPLVNITADPTQPRKFFDPERLNELADSIRQKGVLQPITVRTAEQADNVIIIAGERRYRAAQLAGLEQVPCLVRSGDDAREVALIENLQRENLTPLEESEALQLLKLERDYTDEKLAAVIGKSRQAVSESLQLTTLPDVVKTECRTFGNVGKVQLLQVLRAGDEEKQLALWEAIRTGRVPTARAAREATRKPTVGRPKNFHHVYRNVAEKVHVTVVFQKSSASSDEIRSALQGALEELH